MREAVLVGKKISNPNFLPSRFWNKVEIFNKKEKTNESNMETIREFLMMTSKSGFERFLMLAKVVDSRKFGPVKYYEQNTLKF